MRCADRATELGLEHLNAGLEFVVLRGQVDDLLLHLRPHDLVALAALTGTDAVQLQALLLLVLGEVARGHKVLGGLTLASR